jgi:hypothetical protein
MTDKERAAWWAIRDALSCRNRESPLKLEEIAALKAIDQMLAEKGSELPGLPFEVREQDEPDLMTWPEAMDKFKDNPDGWRLPTKDELSLMYQHKDILGGFASAYYWSSSENSSNYAWCQNFYNGDQYNYSKTNTKRFRVVRDKVRKTEPFDLPFEVKPHDEPEPMTWYESMEKFKDDPDGWRLPTRPELSLMYEHKDKLGGFASDIYWSSSEDDSDDAWAQYFGSGCHSNGSKYNYLRVRAVRDKVRKTEPNRTKPKYPPIPGYYLVRKDCWRDSVGWAHDYWDGEEWDTCVSWDQWDWPPAPRHNIPPWAEQWVCFSDGSREWAAVSFVIGNTYSVRTVLHTEGR